MKLSGREAAQVGRVFSWQLVRRKAVASVPVNRAKLTLLKTRAESHRPTLIKPPLIIFQYTRARERVTRRKEIGARERERMAKGSSRECSRGRERERAASAARQEARATVYAEGMLGSLASVSVQPLSTALVTLVTLVDPSVSSPAPL